jgi:hypothetical protein
MSLTAEQIGYLRDHKTTALPPNMFKRLLSTGKRPPKKNDSEDFVEGNVLDYAGFQLRNKFPQNVALMKDGSFVYCKRFTVPSGHIAPVIEGYKFEWVRQVFFTIISRLV